MIKNPFGIDDNPLELQVQLNRTNQLILLHMVRFYHNVIADASCFIWSKKGRCPNHTEKIALAVYPSCGSVAMSHGMPGMP